MESKSIIEEINNVKIDENVKFDEKEFFDKIHLYYSNLENHTVKDKQRFYIWLDKMWDNETNHTIFLIENEGLEAY